MGIISKTFIELSENCTGFVSSTSSTVSFHVIPEPTRNRIKHVKYVYIFPFKCTKLDLYFSLRFIHGFKKSSEK